MSFARCKSCHATFEVHTPPPSEESEQPFCPGCEALLNEVEVPPPPRGDLSTGSLADAGSPPDPGAGAPRTLPEDPRRQTHQQESWSGADLPTVPGYTIMEVLGRGGMGIVFKAQQINANGRIVAIKMVLGRKGYYPELDERFEREVKAVSVLEHPNIVRVYDVGTVDRQLYFSMEFCPGGTLHDRLKKQIMPPRDAAETVATLARAMGYVHERRIVHRDLKPLNVMYAAGGVPKIADFGLAKDIESEAGQTASGTVMGTVGYMSPEQARGQGSQATPETDVYALGAILYSCLTGRAPFSGSTVPDTLQQIEKDDPVPIRRLVPKTPRDLETICLKCLEKEPTDRYRSAAALADDLGRYLGGEPIAARPAGWLKRRRMWAKRRPAMAGLLVAVALLLAIGSALGVVSAENVFLDEKHRRVQAENDREKAEAAKANAEVRFASTRLRLAEVQASPIHVVTSAGWRKEVLEELRASAARPLTDRDAERHRDLFAAVESRIDLEAVEVVASGINPQCLAVSRDGSMIAVGDSHGALGANVRLYFRGGRPASSKLVKDGLTTGSNGIRSMSFSPDGRWLVAGSKGGQLIAWDTTAPDRPERRLTPGHRGWVNGVAFTRDGTTLVSVSAEKERGDRTMALWDAASWNKIATEAFPPGQEPLGIQLAEAHDRFLVGFSKGGLYYRAETLSAGKIVQDGEDLRAHQRNQYFRFTPNGDLLALASFSEILLYGYHTDFPIRRLRDAPSEFAHAEPISGLSVDRTGTLLASGAGDNYLKLWDLTTGALLLRLFFPGDEGVIPEFDPVTDELLVAANSRLTRYRILRPDTVRALGAQKGSYESVAFAADNAVATATWQPLPSGTSSMGELAVWDAADGRRIAHHFFPSVPGQRATRPSVAARPPDGVLLSAGMPGVDYLVWDWKGKKDPQPVTLPKPRFGVDSHLRFAPDAKALWGVFSGPRTDYVRCLGWPDQIDLLAEGDKVAALLANRSTLTCLDVGRTWAVVGSLDYTVRLIHTTDRAVSWKAFLVGKDNPVHSIAISPDEGLVLAGTRRGTITAFRIPSGERIDLPAQHNDRVEAVAFAPGGELLATGGRDHTIRLWSRAGDSFRPVVTYPAGGPVIDLKFSPEGAKLAFVVEGQRAFNVWDIKLFRDRLRTMSLDW